MRPNQIISKSVSNPVWFTWFWSTDEFGQHWFGKHGPGCLLQIQGNNYCKGQSDVLRVMMDSSRHFALHFAVWSARNEFSTTNVYAVKCPQRQRWHSCWTARIRCTPPVALTPSTLLNLRLHLMISCDFELPQWVLFNLVYFWVVAEANRNRFTVNATLW